MGEHGWSVRGVGAGTRALVLGVLVSLAATGACGQDAGLFRRLAGTWSGTGTVRATNGTPERLRCRADYAPGGDEALHMQFLCASDSFKLQVATDLQRQGDRLSGTWREASYGVSGQVSGRVRGDRIEADVSGLGLTARLSMVLRGQTQAVTLASQGQLGGTSAVTLRRR